MRLRERLFTGSILIIVTGLILSYRDPILFGLQVCIFAGLAMREYFNLLKHESVYQDRLFGILFGVSITFLALVEAETAFTSLQLMFLMMSCALLFFMYLPKKDHSRTLTNIAFVFFGFIYISFLLSFIIKVRYLDHGLIWVVYLIVVTKSGDIGAYVLGSLVGKKPLIPHVSPRKTVEGTVAGLGASVCVSLAMSAVLPFKFSWVHLATLGLFLGTLGQLGDLSESLMKRSCRSKDSGAILPGMGGILDVVDSLLFTAPFFYFYIDKIIAY